MHLQFHRLLEKARLYRRQLLFVAGALVVVISITGSLWYYGRHAAAAQSRTTSTITPEVVIPTVALPEFQAGLIPDPANTDYQNGIRREALLHTYQPEHPRFDITVYTVQKGDTVFDIAKKFGLNPSTVLWGNLNVLSDDPHRLTPGQQLNILPVDGVYYQWHDTDGLNGVSKVFGVKPQDIIDYPGNHLDAKTIGDFSHPNIKAGTWLVVPGGHREFISWSAPVNLTRKNPAVAALLGPGACGQVMEGAIGTGSFVWPTTEHWISGFDFSPEANHPAIDIAGRLGNLIFAADTGVVVYAGWNNWGYGNVIVIDHGNGWQTLYAHLSFYQVSCGLSVIKGAQIGNMGSTGNSTGPHLHFEMMHNGAKVNPHQFLPPP